MVKVIIEAVQYQKEKSKTRCGAKNGLNCTRKFAFIYKFAGVLSLRISSTQMDKPLPVYQHPTLTVLIDDSQSFLDSLAFQLNPRFARKLFHDAQAAIDWLHETYWQFIQNKNEPIDVGYETDKAWVKQRSAAIDLDCIHRVVQNPQRFDMPAVLVIDYAMPQMNGLEFCQSVQDLPCKRILLTGQADEKIATDAFKKLIDCFIKKSDSDALNHLEAAIVELQNGFFKEQTSTLSDLLSRHTFAFLADPAIETLVGQLRNRYGFVEHYVFSNPAGILFFDAQGKATLMVIETESSATRHLEVALDQGAPLELLASLQELRLIPFFSDTGGMYLDMIEDSWRSYCLPPQVCQGRENYYWALFDLPAHYLRSSVYSYAKYLRDQGD